MSGYNLSPQNLSTTSISSARSDRSASHIARNESAWSQWASHINCYLQDVQDPSELAPNVQALLNSMCNCANEDLNQCARLLRSMPRNMLQFINKNLIHWQNEPILQNTVINLESNTAPDENSTMSLSTLSNLIKARDNAIHLAQSQSQNEPEWERSVWQRIMEVEGDRNWTHGDLAMKMANGIYSSGLLPDHLAGSYQKPDFVWSTSHTRRGQFWTISTSEGFWCECVGEGKPMLNTDNHALRQVLMAGASCIYHQISLQEPSPAMLIFTVNGHKVFFYQMRAIPVSTAPSVNRSIHQWNLVYTPISQFSLDLHDLSDCLRFCGLTRALTLMDDGFQQHLRNLSEAISTSDLEIWWNTPARKPIQSSNQSGTTSSLPSTPDPSTVVSGTIGPVDLPSSTSRTVHQSASVNLPKSYKGKARQNVVRRVIMRVSSAMKTTVERVVIGWKRSRQDLQSINGHTVQI